VLSYHYEPTIFSVGQVKVHRITRREGAGGTGCDASGASWQDPYGDLDLDHRRRRLRRHRLGHADDLDRSGGGWDSYDVTTLVNSWVNGTQPNHGMLVQTSSETLGAGKDFALYTDVAVAPTLRPKPTRVFGVCGLVERTALGISARLPLPYGSSSG
jgi:hypothetical protein